MQCIAGYAIEKEIERLQQKNVNVAIKRVKSNAPALALSSDSNIDEVNHAKVSKNSLLFIRNVEFLEVAFIYFALKWLLVWVFLSLPYVHGHVYVICMVLFTLV